MLLFADANATNKLDDTVTMNRRRRVTLSMVSVVAASIAAVSVSVWRAG